MASGFNVNKQAIRKMTREMEKEFAKNPVRVPVQAPPSGPTLSFELVLEEKIKDLLLERHDKNGELFSQFFANPDFQQMLLSYLAGTYDEFRGRAG